MATTVRQLARRALARLGLHLDHVGAGTYTLRREPWPARFRLVDSGPHAALLAPPRPSPGDRWHRDRRLFTWIAERQLADLLAQYEVSVVVDVGARAGQYGQLLRRVGYRGRILSFEPDPHRYAELAQWSAHDAGWSAHRIAVGADDGPDRRRRRLATLLDELLPGGAGNHAEALFLRLDAGGHDLPAFAGLGHRRAHVVGLQSVLIPPGARRGRPGLAETLAVYESAGFALSGLYPLDRDPQTLCVLEYDGLLVRTH
ncbi:class I SAM-dependent methyltransferase [Rhizomonospora bruguierae]|uniref:hypothetical protein n=1 Tax=Rhizomonospora bruguierae TaxID=1581705 RepID=UPI001BCA9C3D|nr:hypothetical protein [Micromonospora sp. NBRC 107566]